MIGTPEGCGPGNVRRLADLTVLSGRILIGLPGSPPIDEPSPVRPEVPPGRYAVFASLVELSGSRRVAFVTARFAAEEPVSWEEAGAFFTDFSTGCLMDEDFVPLLEARAASEPEAFCRLLFEVRIAVLTDGDGSLLLDVKTGANAIVFDLFDSRYPCYLGRDRGGKPVCLVVDCR
jgi:hypothetical protein